MRSVGIFRQAGRASAHSTDSRGAGAPTRTSQRPAPGATSL